MKKVLTSIILLMLILTLTSCSNVSVFRDNNEKIADETFNEIISAVRLKDESKIADMFSDAIKSEGNLTQSALRFIDYIHGDIISFSSASEAGVGADYKTENGKMRKEIQSAFCINTTESTYYVAIKECIKDGLDDNIGLVSIYIIESNNWTEDYVYRGDGKWAQGINVDEGNTGEDSDSNTVDSSVSFTDTI